MPEKDYPYNAPPPLTLLWEEIEHHCGTDMYVYLHNRYIEAQRRYSAVLRLKEHKRDVESADRHRAQGLRPLSTEKKIARSRKILANKQAYVDGTLDFGEDDHD